MALPNNIGDREYQKFVESGGAPAVRVFGSNISGNFTPQGLTTAGRVTVVSINNSTWTALPATALTNRNQINVQNNSGESIKLNYDNTTVGFVGMIIRNGGERQYSITDDIVLYAMSETNTVDIEVEELS
jgi:hypothetical protein